MNMQAVSVCFAIDHVDGDHTIDKPARLRLLARRTSRRSGATGCSSFRSPHPRTLAISERSFTPNPDDDPLPVVADQRLERRRRQPVDVPAHRRAPQLFSAGRLRQRHLPGQLADDRLLRGARSSTCPDAGDAPGQRARELSPLGPLLAADRGAARRRRHGLPGLRLRGDVTGTARRPGAGALHPRVAGASGPSTPSSSRTCRSRCAATRARCSYRRLGRRRHVPHRPAPLDRRRQLHRRRRPARSRSRSARCIPRRVENLLPAGKNIGTTHITNGSLPAAPGRVERRRGRRRARRVLPEPAARRRTQVHATTPQLLADFQAQLTARRRASCAGPTSPATDPTTMRGVTHEDTTRISPPRSPARSALGLTACGGDGPAPAHRPGRRCA